MSIGVKFCGGCNPRFERGLALEDLQRDMPFLEFEHAKEGVIYDALLVIGGCTNCCASYCQYQAEKGVIRMWDKSHLDRVKSELKKISED